VPKITVLFNATAGGKTTPNDITAAFEAAGATARIVTFKSGEDIVALARDAAKTSDVVVAAGGDGTVNAVASVVAGTAVTLGVLPVGTLNHFAKDMTLPLDLNEAAAVIVAGRVVSVDVAEVSGRIFVNNSSIGVYPNAVAIREQLRETGHRHLARASHLPWRPRASDGQRAAVFRAHTVRVCGKQRIRARRLRGRHA
jgi:diacylglycerol kinase family enzyme